MKTKLYVITTMSNMHVGSGEYNTGVIDNLVQRDLINQFPNVNSSSLKGALREFFDSCNDIKEKGAFIKDVFGSSPRDKSEDMQAGSFRFFEANILSYPVRSDKAAYLRAVSVDVIKEMIVRIKEFGITNEDVKQQVAALKSLSQIPVKEGCPIVLTAELAGAIIEEFDLIAQFNTTLPDTLKKQIIGMFGERIVLLHNADFARLCGCNRLPVVSRNYLESGKSENLWYEEVVPRLTQFYFIVIEDERYESEFDKNISSSLIQIGGNSSIGYGFSKIELFPSLNSECYEN